MSKPTEYKYDLIVYIGRFQPFHIAHQSIIKMAGGLSPKVLVLVGSSDSSPSIKNPWSYEEREDMILGSSSKLARGLYVEPLPDAGTMAQWIIDVSTKAEKYTITMSPKIAIIGHDKDHTSFYLNHFKQWDYIEAPKFPPHQEAIDATLIRKMFFTNKFVFAAGVLPEYVYNVLEEELKTNDKADLVAEYRYIQDYKKEWLAAPYAPIFVTVDSVVVQSGHVLLVQRGGQPGKGLWAMPGGFIEPTETIEESMIRELREETRLKVVPKVLKGSILCKEVFDRPERSLRGRTITHAFLIHLDDSESLPKVKGSDDAMDAKWIPFGEFANMQKVMFEDHYHIVSYLINKLKEED